MKGQLTVRTSLLLLVFVVLGTYYPAIFAPINSVDDPGTITFLLNNDSFSLREIFRPGATYFRPFLLLSFLADKYLWGLHESFMHLENILFHLANVLLLFAVVRRSCRTLGVDSVLVPLTAALFFALHPINTEPVNWISGRTDLIACVFLLGSAFFLVGPELGPLASLAAALLVAAGCLAKETSIFFLPAAFLAPFFRPGPGTGLGGITLVARRNWWHLLICFATGVAFLMFRTMGSHHGDEGVSRVVTHVAGAQNSALWDTFRLPLKAAGFYLKKLFVPFPLNFGIIHVSELYLAVGVLLVPLLVWLALRRTLPAFYFICAACTGVSALIIPLLNLTWTPLAERYMYIPSAFFVTGLVLAVHSWQGRLANRRVVPVLACCLLGIATYGTVTRTLLWQDNLALFQDTLKKSPDFVPAQNEIAVALQALGEREKSAAVISSMDISSSLINYQYALVAKAGALAQGGDVVGAEKLLLQGLRDPGKCEERICQMLLDLYEFRFGQKQVTRAEIYPGSVEALTRLYRLSNDPFYQYRLGIVHMTQKEWAKAKESFAIAAKRAPEKAVYREPARKLAAKMEQRLSGGRPELAPAGR